MSIIFYPLFTLSGLYLGWLILQSGEVRSSLTVLQDLSHLPVSSESLLVDDAVLSKAEQSQRLLSRTLGVAVTSSPARLKRVAFQGALVFLCICSLCQLVSGVRSVQAAMLAVLMGAACGYLFEKYRTARSLKNKLEEIEFHLPLVLERLLMAVQSGLDVIAALNIITKPGTANEPQTVDCMDPVSRLLALVIGLSEAGLGFSKTLENIAELIPSTALKHSFVHLALAYEEGGELLVPLRELSDASQLHYQEVVEEQIAGLPVKATLPLVLTFAGLIIFFVTTPLLQILDLVSQASFK